MRYLQSLPLNLTLIIPGLWVPNALLHFQSMILVARLRVPCPAPTRTQPCSPEPFPLNTEGVAGKQIQGKTLQIRNNQKVVILPLPTKQNVPKNENNLWVNSLARFPTSVHFQLTRSFPTYPHPGESFFQLLSVRNNQI